MIAVTAAPQIAPRTLAQISERVRLLRRGLEAMIDAQPYDTALSLALDQAIAIEESLPPAALEPERPVTDRSATTCTRCGAPRKCCIGSAAPGDPADHGAST